MQIPCQINAQQFSIERFLSPEEALKLKAQRDTELVFKESRPLGGAWALQQLWTEIGIDRVIKKGLRKRSFSAPIERAIFAMVANRVLRPTLEVRGQPALIGHPSTRKSRAALPGSFLRRGLNCSR